MIRVTSYTAAGLRSFAVIVCRQGELSERHRMLNFSSSLECRPGGDEIEVYDETQRGKKGFHPQLGQFVIAYPLESVAGIGLWGWTADDGHGINLDGGEPAWSLDGSAKVEVMLFAARMLRDEATCTVCGQEAGTFCLELVPPPADVTHDRIRPCCLACHAEAEGEPGRIPDSLHHRELWPIPLDEHTMGASRHLQPIALCDDDVIRRRR